MRRGTPIDREAKLRILDAAAEAFLAYGFDKTTIDDIADRVGATKGLVYYHFRSKFDVFLAAYERGMCKVRAEVEPYAEGPGSGAQRLGEMAVAHLENLMSDLAYHHVVHQGVRAQTSAGLRPRHRAGLEQMATLRHEYEAMFRRVVAAGIADGSLREAPLDLATRTVLSSLNAVDMWYRPREPADPAETRRLARSVADLVMGGVTAG